MTAVAGKMPPAWVLMGELQYCNQSTGWELVSLGLVQRCYFHLLLLSLIKVVMLPSLGFTGLFCFALPFKHRISLDFSFVCHLLRLHRLLPCTFLQPKLVCLFYNWI